MPGKTAGTSDALPATVIVFGNEKGGSGKSTTAMHVIVGLLRLGFKVGSLDIDSRQWTLTRYLSNRAQTVKREALRLPMPQHVFLSRSDRPMRDEAEAEDKARLEAVLAKLRTQVDYIVVDCPGTDTYLGRLATSYADKLVTPVNDSFIDLDLLANVDGSTVMVQRPSVYSEMVWEQRKIRAKRDGGTIDWVVLRNRLSSINARNKIDMARVMEDLSKRIGFRIAPGFAERVIFRELFLRGLTMLDTFEIGDSGKPKLSHIAARQEVRGLINALQLPSRQAASGAEGDSMGVAQ
ncbi:MAG: AAA family ATPase [Proteobacteria bacterium]|nr:AAA family ATPase [Pseudomonadota bacterium]